MIVDNIMLRVLSIITLCIFTLFLHLCDLILSLHLKYILYIFDKKNKPIENENRSKCEHFSQFVRSTPAHTVGQKQTGGVCKGGQKQRACRGGYLLDNVLDWEHDLPDKDLDLAYNHSCLADINICLGSTMQINPSGGLALKNKKFGGKLVICNLQPTKHVREKKQSNIFCKSINKNTFLGQKG